MNFELTAERRMLRETLSRFLADHYGIEHRNAVAYSAPFHDPGLWKKLVDLGVLFALVEEGRGGFGGAGFDVATVFETLGAALCPEPMLGMLMASRILGDAGTLLDGTLRYAVALDGGLGAREGPDGWVLSGRKSMVYGGGLANRILVSVPNAAGMDVFEIDPDTAEINSFGMIDGGNAAEVHLENTPAILVAKNATSRLSDALDHGALALCAEAVGAMDTSSAMLLDYLKTRQQFGQPIGNFQVLQHRMVDLMTEIEQARSITILAASRMGTADQSRTVSMAKSLVGRVAQMVAEDLVQMHGGIAMTWEYPASHFAKRLVMIDHQLGNCDDHLRRVAMGYQG